jgi:hypothetical protein
VSERHPDDPPAHTHAFEPASATAMSTANQGLATVQGTGGASAPAANSGASTAPASGAADGDAAGATPASANALWSLFDSVTSALSAGATARSRGWACISARARPRGMRRAHLIGLPLQVPPRSHMAWASPQMVRYCPRSPLPLDPSQASAPPTRRRRRRPAGPCPRARARRRPPLGPRRRPRRGPRRRKTQRWRPSARSQVGRLKAWDFIHSAGCAC